MAYKSKPYRSQIPPPTWNQVAWLSISGGAWLLLTWAMSFYNARIDAAEKISGFQENYQLVYSIVVFICIIAVSAIVLALWKVMLLTRNRIRKGAKKRAGKKRS